MNAAARPEWRQGQVVELRKPHPCGGRRWQIVRLGADIRIVCQTCRRRVLLAREEFDRTARPMRDEAEAP